MKSFLELVKQLPTGKRAIVVAAIVIIILTWLGVCLILTTYPALSQ